MAGNLLGNIVGTSTGATGGLTGISGETTSTAPTQYASTAAAQAAANKTNSAAQKAAQPNDANINWGTLSSYLSSGNYADAWKYAASFGGASAVSNVGTTSQTESGLANAGSGTANVGQAISSSDQYGLQNPAIAALESSQGVSDLDPNAKWNAASDTAFYDAAAPYWNSKTLGSDPSGGWGSASALSKDATTNAAAGGAPNVQQYGGIQQTAGGFGGVNSAINKYFPTALELTADIYSAGALSGLDSAIGATVDNAVGTGGSLLGTVAGGAGAGAAVGAENTLLGAAMGGKVTLGSAAENIGLGAVGGGISAGLGQVGTQSGLPSTVAKVIGKTGSQLATGALGNALAGSAAPTTPGSLSAAHPAATATPASGTQAQSGAERMAANPGLTYNPGGGTTPASGIQAQSGAQVMGANPGLTYNPGGGGPLQMAADPGLTYNPGGGTTSSGSNGSSYLGAGTLAAGLGVGALASGIQGNNGNMASTDSSLASTITGALPGVLQAGIGTAGSLAAANAESNADQNAITTQQGNLGNINSIWANQQQTGQGANTALQSSLGLNGQTANPSNFLNMPGYQFAVQQGTQAAQRQAAAMGNAYTPNTAAAIGQYVTGTASQDYNTYISQLMGAAGLGTTANQGLQTGSQQSSNIISQLQQNIGQAQAAGYTGVASSASGLFSPNGAGTGLINSAGQALNGSGGGMNSSGVPQGNGTTSSNASDPFAGTSLANNQNAINAYDQSNGPTAGDISGVTSSATGNTNFIDPSLGGDSPVGGFTSDDSFGDDLSDIF